MALATALACWLAGSLLFKERLKITDFSKNGSASEPVSQTYTRRFLTSLEIAPEVHWGVGGCKGPTGGSGSHKGTGGSGYGAGLLA